MGVICEIIQIRLLFAEFCVKYPGNSVSNTWTLDSYLNSNPLPKNSYISGWRKGM